MSSGHDSHETRKTTPLDDQNFRRRALWVREKCDEVAQTLDWYLDDIFHHFGIIFDDNHLDEGQGDQLAEVLQSKDDRDHNANANNLEVLRSKSNAINRTLLIKDMQLQVLCRILERRQAEVAELKAEQVNDIQEANAIVHRERRLPQLPIEITLRIFGMLYQSDKNLRTIQTLLEDAETPHSWERMIWKELPVVIAEDVEHLEASSREIDLGPNPPFFPLDGDLNEVVHQSNYLCLALRHSSANRKVLARALQIPLRQLTLHSDESWRNSFFFENMLNQCWSVIPRLHKLSVDQEAPFTRNLEEAVALSLREDFRDFKFWENAQKDSLLRVAAIPAAFLHPLVPVMCNLAELELTIPPYVIEYSTLAASLELLPASLLVLKLRYSIPSWEDQPRFTDTEPQIDVELPNLQDFVLTDFAPEACKVIMRTIVCPRLQSFSIKEDRRFVLNEEPVEFSFINDIYRELRVLHLYSPDLIRRPSILDALWDCDEEGNWLLPNLDTIAFRAFAVESFQTIARVVEARLDAKNAASIQSLTIKEGFGPVANHLIYSLYLGNLSLIVPNVVLLTSRDDYI